MSSEELICEEVVAKCTAINPIKASLKGLTSHTSFCVLAVQNLLSSLSNLAFHFFFPLCFNIKLISDLRDMSKYLIALRATEKEEAI